MRPVAARKASKSRRWIIAAIAGAMVSQLGVSTSRATDKLTVPRAAGEQKITVIARPDGEAGELGHQRIEFAGNGAVSCGRLRLKGTMKQQVVEQVSFTSLEMASCLYLGRPTHVSTSACEVVVTGGGRGELRGRGGACDVRFAAAGCSVRLEEGPFLKIGYHNTGSPSEVTGLTEPVVLAGTATGASCISPGPVAAEYKGYLRLSAHLHGHQEAFKVIL